MKLVRYGKPGQEKPGLIDAGGHLRDLSKVIADIGPDTLDDKTLKKLAKLKTDQLPLVKGQQRMGCPVSHVPQFIAIGLNYVDHAKEAGMPIPKEPVVFLKANSSIQGPDDDVMLPKGSKKGDWEVELGIVIGTEARYVSQKDALNYVAGYCVVNDVSEREYQIERGGTWDKGKSHDTFGPTGPWMVTKDEIKNPQDLEMWLDVNGERRQDANTRDMIFNVPTLIAYISKFMILEPGDVIFTGTCSGVGAAANPPKFLRAGDTVRVEIERLGAIVAHCVDEDPVA